MADFEFFLKEKIRPDSGKNNFRLKKGSPSSKLGTQGTKETPPQNQILMEVMALKFFDLRSSRGPQWLLESAI